MASTQQFRHMGLGRKRPDAVYLRRAARRHASAVCALLGLVLTAAGRPEILRETVRAAFPGLQLGDTTPAADVLLRDAEAAAARGQHEEAEKLNGMLIAQYPDHPMVENALVARARALVAAHRLEDAQAVAEELRVRSPRSDKLLGVLLEIADEHYRNGRHQQAARCYTDVIGLVTRYERPEREAESAMRAPYAARMARHLEKEREKAERTGAERVARFNLALCLDASGNRGEALHAYHHFGRRFPADPRRPEACFRMGMLERGASRLEAAAENFTKVWEAESAAPEWRAASIYHAGRCYERLGRLDEARHAYRQALALEPKLNAFRLSALSRLAVLVRETEPLFALEIYRDLAENSQHKVLRAIAVQSLSEMQEESAIAALDS